MTWPISAAAAICVKLTDQKHVHARAGADMSPRMSATTPPLAKPMLDALITQLEGEGYRRRRSGHSPAARAVSRPSGEDIRPHVSPRRMAKAATGACARSSRFRSPATIWRAPPRRNRLPLPMPDRCSACARANRASSCRQVLNPSGAAMRQRPMRSGGPDVDLVGRLGVARPLIRIGDVGLITDLLDALAIPAAARRRLLRAIAHRCRNGGGDGPGAAHGGIGRRRDAPCRPSCRIEGQDPTAARVFVEDILAIAGLKMVGGDPRPTSPHGSWPAPRSGKSRLRRDARRHRSPHWR